jgi:hypothetical protein
MTAQQQVLIKQKKKQLMQKLTLQLNKADNYVTEFKVSRRGKKILPWIGENVLNFEVSKGAMLDVQ